MSNEPRPPARDAIHKAFGVQVGELRRHGVGWESTGWTDGVWFVKVWHEAPPSNLALLEQLELPVPIPVARRTIDGARWAWTADGQPYGVFPFFAGRLATPDDWRETARTLRLLHDQPLIEAPRAAVAVPCIADLRERLDHPWLGDRRSEVEQCVDRLESVIERAAATSAPVVVVHTDFGGDNLLVDDAGNATAILDWDNCRIGPREHDVWLAFHQPDPVAFLTTYGAADLDRTHLEFALLQRAVQDLTARLVANRDRAGVETWGFDRMRGLDAELRCAAPFLRERVVWYASGPEGPRRAQTTGQA
jgi:aminoglycoside phosphotransferase (APT) family kinase protein